MVMLLKVDVMFSQEHAIWKFAYAGDELDDWLPHAEFLIGEWSNQHSEGVKFRNTFEIILAALLLEDNLLPAPARVAFARAMIETISEVTTKKIRVDCLHIEPPKPGRQGDRRELGVRLFKVRKLIGDGKSSTEAYKMVAEEHSKSPETIRRDYERAIKRSLKLKGTGENSK